MVLRMLQEGKIGPEEAEELLAALERAARQGPRAEPPPEDRSSRRPDLDLGQIGRGIRDAVRGVTEGLQKLAETTPWRDFGDWFRTILAGAKVTVDRDVAFPSGVSVDRVLVKGESGRVCVKGSPQGEASGVAHVTAWGVDEATARRLAEGVRLFTEVRDGVLEISAGAPKTESRPPSGPTGEYYMVALDIRIPATAALTVNTTSGSLEITDLDGETTLHTASGRVRLAGLRGPVTVVTSSGEVSGEHAGAARLDVKSSSGGVKLSLAPAPGGAIYVATSSGDAVIRLAADARTRVEATSVSGEVSVKAPLQVEEIRRTRFVGVQGAAESTIRLTSASGNLRIEAAGS
jgi:hypothetical protein